MQLIRDQRQKENLWCHKMTVFASRCNLDSCNNTDRFKVSLLPFHVFSRVLGLKLQIQYCEKEEKTTKSYKSNFRNALS